MHKSQKIDSRPAYFDGQLLQAADFVAEQQYHRNARRRHNMALHDWGVASGLEVRLTGESQITVQPGTAIDANGHEIDVAHPVVFDLAGFPAHVRLRVTLYYRHDDELEREHRNRIDSHAVIDVSDSVDDRDTLLLATLQLDGAGKVDPRSIDTGAIRRIRTRISPGSVGASALAEDLSLGWVAMPFRPWPLAKGPKREKVLAPPFLVGAIEARTHEVWEGAANDQGGGGTMAIIVPFGARRVLQLRMAGQNDKQIDVHLIRGGFDPQAGEHIRQPLLEKTIKGRNYNEVFRIEHGTLDPEYNTLALWVHAHGGAVVSLVALQFSY